MNVTSYVLLLKIKNNFQLPYVCHFFSRYFLHLTINQNKFEDSKGVNRSRKFVKRSNGQNYIYRILKIGQHERHKETGAELWCPRRVSSSCSTNYTSRGTHLQNLVTSHERGKKVGIAAATNEAYT